MRFDAFRLYSATLYIGWTLSTITFQYTLLDNNRYIALYKMADIGSGYDIVKKIKINKKQR